MKEFLRARSKRFGYDGWALKVRDAEKPLDWTTCTTRREARELRRRLHEQDIGWRPMEVVKVRIRVEVIDS